MKCPACQAEFSGSAKFCSQCGADLEKGYLHNPTCPKCRNKYPPGINYCDDDGERLVEEEMLLPKCVRCHKVYSDGTKFCPDDGGIIIPDVLKRRPGSPFEVGKKLKDDEYASILDREYTVKSHEYITKGWEIFKENAGGFIGFAAIIFFINLILRYIPMVGFLFVAISAPLLGGFYIVAFKIMLKQDVDFSDFLKGFNYFLPLVLGGLLTWFFTVVGFILLVVPGIYLMVSYLFTLLLIVDREMDFWQAMEVSRKVVTKNWFSMFLFFLVLLLINLGGSLLFLVGLLVTVPLSFCAIAVAYDDIFGIETAYF